MVVAGVGARGGVDVSRRLTGFDSYKPKRLFRIRSTHVPWDELNLNYTADFVSRYRAEAPKRAVTSPPPREAPGPPKGAKPWSNSTKPFVPGKWRGGGNFDVTGTSPVYTRCVPYIYTIEILACVAVRTGHLGL